MLVVSVNVIPYFTQLLSHLFSLFFFFVPWLGNFNCLVFCLKDSSAVADALCSIFYSVAFHSL